MFWLAKNAYILHFLAGEERLNCDVCILLCGELRPKSLLEHVAKNATAMQFCCAATFAQGVLAYTCARRHSPRDTLLMHVCGDLRPYFLVDPMAKNA